MKKLLAFFLAFTVVFSMTAMFTPVSASGIGVTDQIAYIDYLDFSGDFTKGDKPVKNQWAEKDADGNYVNESFKSDDFVDENGNPGGNYYPFALYKSSTGLDYEFKQDYEVLRLTAKDTANPGIVFEFDSFNTYAIGPESSTTPRAEYVKIRFKNSSPSTKLTFMGTNNSFSNGSSVDRRVSGTIEVQPNSAEWQTITVSMVEATMNSGNNYAGGNTWNSFLKKFAIYPFGYGVDNESIVNDEYYVEIDYVVIGSKSYVDSYQSELEKKESNVTSFEFADAVAGSDGKTLKPGTVQETYKLGESLNIEDLSKNLKLNITYAENTYENAQVYGDSVSAVYNFSKPTDLPDDTESWKSKVTLKYGEEKLEYEVTVYNIKDITYKYETDKATDVDKKVYDKLDILKNGFTPTGISVLITHYTAEAGKYAETIKTIEEVELEGTDFAEKVELKDGYYEYLVKVMYFGRELEPIPVKIKDVTGLKVTPVESKAGAIYYGTDLNTKGREVTYGEGENAVKYTVNDFFKVECVYTDGTTKEIEKTGYIDDIKITGDTKTTGGKINATVTFANTAYGINIAQDVEVTVQTPTDISVKLNGKKTFDVDTVLKSDRFSVEYKYADGTSVKVDSADENLTFKYDTSAPGENLTGVLEVNGKKEATFTFGVDEAEFAEDVVKKPAGEKVKLLAPKFPTFWLVTIIIAAIAIVLVGGWAILKYGFKVDFKRKKKFNLDDIF